MNEKHLYDENCPVLYSLNIIGGKWRMPILWYLSQSDLRYNELKRKINGITNIMLTRSLKELEEYGLVHRHQYSEIPPRVEYSLTEAGGNLAPALMAIKEWGLQQIADRHSRDENQSI